MITNSECTKLFSSHSYCSFAWKIDVLVHDHPEIKDVVELSVFRFDLGLDLVDAAIVEAILLQGIQHQQFESGRDHPVHFLLVADGSNGVGLLQEALDLPLIGCKRFAGSKEDDLSCCRILEHFCQLIE